MLHNETKTIFFKASNFANYIRVSTSLEVDFNRYESKNTFLLKDRYN